MLPSDKTAIENMVHRLLNRAEETLNNTEVTGVELSVSLTDVVRINIIVRRPDRISEMYQDYQDYLRRGKKSNEEVS